MTEAEWLACEDPDAMVVRLGIAAHVRKNRLLALACCCRMADLLIYDDIPRLLSVAERWIEGECDTVERKAARRAASALAGRASAASLEDGLTFSDSAAWAVQQLFQKGVPYTPGILKAARTARLKDAGARAHLERLSSEVGDRNRATAFDAEQQAQRRLVRDIFGNPFRPITIAPAWRTDTALALAQQMYESRDFGATPILADALQDAGCDGADILNHCRSNGPHVRGCWVVDLVLGKD